LWTTWVGKKEKEKKSAVEPGRKKDYEPFGAKKIKSRWGARVRVPDDQGGNTQLLKVRRRKPTSNLKSVTINPGSPLRLSRRQGGEVLFP